MWTLVTSSNISAIAYHNEQLLCKFTNGTIYTYEDVPELIFERMKVAESVGRFFHAEIKPHFTPHKLGKDPFAEEATSI